MTDDLRTRIADVLNSFPADIRPAAVVNLEKADAIIAALGLSKQRQQGPYNYMVRYTTGFMTDD